MNILNADDRHLLAIASQPLVDELIDATVHGVRDLKKLESMVVARLAMIRTLQSEYYWTGKHWTRFGKRRAA